MALITCHECKGQVSSEAAACPQCGAKPKQGIGFGTVVVLALAAGLAYTVATLGEHRPSAAAVRPAIASPPEKTERQVEQENYQAAFALDQKAGQEYLGGKLLAFCQKEDRHLNYIKLSTRRVGTGVGLYCVHELYTEYSLSAGSLGPALGEWASEHNALLVKNKVTRVGVWGTGEYSSGAWFTLK